MFFTFQIYGFFFMLFNVYIVSFLILCSSTVVFAMDCCRLFFVGQVEKDELIREIDWKNLYRWEKNHEKKMTIFLNISLIFIFLFSFFYSIFHQHSAFVFGMWIVCEWACWHAFICHPEYNVTPLISYSVECGCSNPKLHILFDLIFYVSTLYYIYFFLYLSSPAVGSGFSNLSIDFIIKLMTVLDSI